MRENIVVLPVLIGRDAGLSSRCFASTWTVGGHRLWKNNLEKILNLWMLYRIKHLKEYLIIDIAKYIKPCQLPQEESVRTSMQTPSIKYAVVVYNNGPAFPW